MLGDGNLSRQALRILPQTLSGRISNAQQGDLLIYWYRPGGRSRLVSTSHDWRLCRMRQGL